LGTESRSQSANKLLALSRIHEELERRSRPRKDRKPSRPTEASRIRRLAAKRERAEIKKDRRAPVPRE
jgi:ribosome-associated protein